MYISKIEKASSEGEDAGLSAHPEVARPRLLIVDDSVVIRSVIERIIESGGQLEIVAKLPHVEAAQAYLRQHRVDVILLDHEMPGRKGLDALPEILEMAQGARVAMLSGYCAEGSESAVRALALGASDIIAKPGIRDYNDGFSAMLTKRLMRLTVPSKIQQLVRSRHEAHLRAVPGGFRLGCLGIGASTGGIHALSMLFANMPHKLGVPILITQHLPATFIPYFATQLSRMVTLPVSIPSSGDLLRQDHIYIAPGDANLQCTREKNGLVHAIISKERASRLDPLPGVDPMFASMAKSYGSTAGAIILTGMGRDGTNGARKIAAAGGLVLAQDEESSVVWGMPGYATQSGVASATLHPSEMMGYFASYVGASA
jgi:two-component system, chemotaxis family, protein-glutamate methylesterase/glutaminase